MNDLEDLHIQSLEVERLLSLCSGNPILEPQLQQRLRELQEEIGKHTIAGTFLPKPVPHQPRAAFFLSGGGSVKESGGIRLALASSALASYEKMFVEQAMHDERVESGRQRRPRGSSEPELLLTGTPKGSFGFEFSPASEDLASIHSRSLSNVANAVALVAEAKDLSDALNAIPPKVVRPLMQFVKTLGDARVDLRFAFGDRAGIRVAAERLGLASQRLERDIHVRDIELHGISRGLIADSGVFEIRVDGEALRCSVSDSLTEDDFTRISGLYNEPTIAMVQETTITNVDGTQNKHYVLLDAQGDPEKLIEQK